jgi:hypothetical protein
MRDEDRGMAKQVARRMLLRILGLAGITLALGPRAAHAVPAPPRLGQFTVLLADAASARHVGRAYLQHVPGDADRGHLLVQLRARFDDKPSREKLMACCREDFAAGRTVTVNGWVLSQTEARLCALAALA